ncbi:MAG: translation initiation factor IF-3 [Candidatus Absconditabacteria bacterium]
MSKFDRNDYKKTDRSVVINGDIKGFQILLLDEEGEKIGVFKKFDALKKGQEEGKDVIQIGFNEKEGLTIAKLMEVGKFLYQSKKDLNEKKKTQKSKGMKEVKFGYNIGDNDLLLKMKKAREFLDDGYSVKFMVVLRGRENIYKDRSYEQMKKIIELLSDISKAQPIKQEKNGYSMILFAKLK